MKPSHTDKILRLTPEAYKQFIDTCMGDTPPNERMKKAAENYIEWVKMKQFGEPNVYGETWYLEQNQYGERRIANTETEAGKLYREKLEKENQKIMSRYMQLYNDAQVKGMSSDYVTLVYNDGKATIGQIRQVAENNNKTVDQLFGCYEKWQTCEEYRKCFDENLRRSDDDMFNLLLDRKYSQTRESLDERYENISSIIAEKCDKNWLREKCTSEDMILEECVRLKSYNSFT